MQANQPLGKSDHVVLTWSCVYEQEQPNDAKSSKISRFNFRRGKYEEMLKHLSKIDWKVLDRMDVQEAWNYLKKVLHEATNLFVPMFKKRKRRKKTVPWWNEALIQEVKRKHKAWKEYVISRTVEKHRVYAQQRNSTTLKIRKARNEYEASLVKVAKSEPRKLYRYIRSQLTVKPRVGPLENQFGQLTETDEETAEELNRFFKSIFVDEDPTNLPDFSVSMCDSNTFNNIIITPQLVINELKMLKVDKAAGPDGLPSILLQACAEVLVTPLTAIFRKSLEVGKLPLDWKQAIITPLFKKGKKVKPGNYRPVSLTSQVCKVLERIVKKHIINYFEENQYMSTHQHGFVKKRSCT